MSASGTYPYFQQSCVSPIGSQNNPFYNEQKSQISSFLFTKVLQKNDTFTLNCSLKNTLSIAATKKCALTF